MLGSLCVNLTLSPPGAPPENNICNNTPPATVGELHHCRPPQGTEKTSLELVPKTVDSYLVSLRDCCNSKALTDGKLVHKRIVDDGYAQNRMLANTLIQMYGKCGSFAQAHDVFIHLEDKNVFTWTIMLGACVDCGKVEEAVRIFDQMPRRNIVAWNIIIAACAQHGWSSKAFEYYNALLREAVPNKITFLNLLPFCSHKEHLMRGIVIHGHTVKFGVECDTSVGNVLVNMYGKCDDLESAERLFLNIPELDLFSWNTMISVYAHNKQSKKAKQLLPQMQMRGIAPDFITYVGLIDACTTHTDPYEGEDVYKWAICDGFESNVLLGTAIVNMYGKHKRLDAAKRSFNNIEGRDLIAWNAVAEASAQVGNYADAYKLLEQMQSEGFSPDLATFISVLSSCTSCEALNTGREVHTLIHTLGLELDVTLGNTLLNMYGKCGSLDEAWKVFGQIAGRNVVSWNSMINACVECRQAKKALELFQCMREEGAIPDEVTLLGIIEACASQAVLSEAKEVHKYVQTCGLVVNDMMVSALIKMYSKCGNLEYARRVFDERPCKDVVLWNTMMATYAQHGSGKKGLEVFEEMMEMGVRPSESTLAIVLSACSHAGLASEGQKYFLTICQEYGINPTMEHFNVLIDLLGRSGQISDVEHLINSLHLEPNATSWLTLLGACKNHSDTEVGVRAAGQVLKSDPTNSGPYMLYANIQHSQDSSTG